MRLNARSLALHSVLLNFFDELRRRLPAVQ
jgi:hypothetical protein